MQLCVQKVGSSRRLTKTQHLIREFRDFRDSVVSVAVFVCDFRAFRGMFCL